MKLKLLICFLSISLLVTHDAFAFLPLSPGTIIIQQTTTTGGTKQGTYNTTLANNAVINQGGYKLNFINGTGNPINVKNSTNGMVNVTIGLSSSIGVTSLNALTGALTIACVSGNTTCTTSGGNTITINTAYNIVTTGLAAQTISKQLTLNNLILGGDADVGSNALTNNGHKSTLPSTSGVLCQTNQTTTCGAASASITSINSQTGPAINLVRGSPGNITITNSTNLIKIDTGQNIANLATTNNQTFLGHVNFTGPSNMAPIGLGMLSTPPTNLHPGYLWMDSSTGNNLKYRSSAGTSITTAGIQTANVFTAGNTFSNTITEQSNMTVSTGQNLFMGTANITTTAVRGYLYLSVTDGTPTGTPASHTGGVPVLFDGKTNRLCIYNSGWKCVQLS